MRVIAVDWSGARRPERSLWLAEVRGRRLTQLEGGRTREELVEHLIATASDDPRLAVGLDFAFSFPEWFVRAHADDALSFWDVVAARGEEWLASCRPPFWRDAGTQPPASDDAYRRTDRELAVGPIRPASVFKLVGPTQVGPGAIRGMPLLARLRRAGFSIWPFDDARLPVVVEIWPRVLTQAVVKSRRAARVEYLATRCPEIDEPLRGVAASTDDAFDAAVSAVVMARHHDELLALKRERERALEGRIWRPRARLDSTA